MPEHPTAFNRMYLRTRSILAKSKAAKCLYHGVQAALIAALFSASPTFLAKLRYRLAWGRWPNLQAPHTFDEKLLWLMLYWKHPLKAICGDKYTVRSYAEKAGLDHLLPFLYGAYERAADIDFAALPNRFVLKCSHACKTNIFCANKSDLDLVHTVRDLDLWMRTDYSRSSGELHYGDMIPRIICEEYLEQPGSILPNDYKLHCFGGRVHCTMACVERAPNGTCRLAFYDRDWGRRLMYEKNEISARSQVEAPLGYIEMLDVAEVLAKTFPFVRVDFYCIGDRVVLGELTFTPGACVSSNYLTRLAQEEMGRLLPLPQERIM